LKAAIAVASSIPPTKKKNKGETWETQERLQTGRTDKSSNTAKLGKNN